MTSLSLSAVGVQEEDRDGQEGVSQAAGRLQSQPSVPGTTT